MFSVRLRQVVWGKFRKKKYFAKLIFEVTLRKVRYYLG